MIYPAARYTGSGIKVTVGTKRGKRFKLQTGKRCMRYGMTRFAGLHLFTFSMRSIMAGCTFGQYILITQAMLKAVKSFMAFPTFNPVSPLAVFDGHEDFIMTPGTVKGCQFLSHLFHILTVRISLVCRRD
jgi:hypothetical protein